MRSTRAVRQSSFPSVPLIPSVINIQEMLAMGTSNRSQLPEGQVSKSQLLGRPYVWASYWETHAHVTGRGPGASSQIGCEPWGLARLGVSSWGEQGDLGPAPGLDCLSTTTGAIKHFDTIYKNIYTCVCVFYQQTLILIRQRGGAGCLCCVLWRCCMFVCMLVRYCFLPVLIC